MSEATETGLCLESNNPKLLALHGISNVNLGKISPSLIEKGLSSFQKAIEILELDTNHTYFPILKDIKLYVKKGKKIKWLKQKEEDENLSQEIYSFLTSKNGNLGERFKKLHLEEKFEPIFPHSFICNITMVSTINLNEGTNPRTSNNSIRFVIRKVRALPILESEERRPNNSSVHFNRTFNSQFQFGKGNKGIYVQVLNSMKVNKLGILGQWMAILKMLIMRM